MSLLDVLLAIPVPNPSSLHPAVLEGFWDVLSVVLAAVLVVGVCFFLRRNDSADPMAGPPDPTAMSVREPTPGPGSSQNLPQNGGSVS
jgi:hypothetical protein